MIVTKRDVCREFSVSHKTVETWTRLGMPTIKTGSSRQSAVRYDLATVRRWINARSRAARKAGAR